jgi:chaperonin GroES
MSESKVFNEHLVMPGDPQVKPEDVVVKGRLRAAPGFVVIKPQKKLEQSAGGIVLPTQAQEKVCEGRVVSHERGPFTSDCMDVFSYAEGEFVIYSRYAGTPYRHEGVDYLFVREEDIMGFVEEAK